MFAIPIDLLIEAFLDCSLPKADWTHQAHLRVGLWHVHQLGPDAALVRLRDGIRRLNESHGTANTDTGGYHETITRLYVLVMDRFLTAADRSRSLDDLTVDYIARYPTSDLPLRYYSRGRLYSLQARRDWIEPDLAAFDPGEREA